MKEPLAFVSAILLVVGLVLSGSCIKSRRRESLEQFKVQAKAASGAIYRRQQDGIREFECSGTVFGYDDHDNALFATARHCVYDEPNYDWGIDGKLIGPLEVSFVANQSGPYYTAVPLKISAVDDLAILLVINGADRPAVGLGDESRTAPKQALLNYGYGLGFGQFDLTEQFDGPRFTHYPQDIMALFPFWPNTMPIEGVVLPGMSGSGLFDPKEQRLVGVVVGQLSKGGMNVAIPVSRLWNLLADPHPFVPAAEKPDASKKTPIRIVVE